MDARAAHFLPCNTSQIARDKTDGNPASVQSGQHCANAWAYITLQVGSGTHVDRLRSFHHLRHMLRHEIRRRSRPSHHLAKDVAVKHSRSVDTFGCGFEPGNAAHTLFERLPMVRARPPDQSTVNIEENQS